MAHITLYLFCIHMVQSLSKKPYCDNKTNMSYNSIPEPLLYGSLKLLPSLCNAIIICVKHSFLIVSVRVNDGNEASISIHCSLGVIHNYLVLNISLVRSIVLYVLSSYFDST